MESPSKYPFVRSQRLHHTLSRASEKPGSGMLKDATDASVMRSRKATLLTYGPGTMNVVAMRTFVPLAVDVIGMWRICSIGVKIANVCGTTSISASRQYCRVAGLVPAPA